jgi:hypothetical protein
MRSTNFLFEKRRDSSSTRDLVCLQLDSEFQAELRSERIILEVFLYQSPSDIGVWMSQKGALARGKSVTLCRDQRGISPIRSFDVVATLCCL